MEENKNENQQEQSQNMNDNAQQGSQEQQNEEKQENQSQEQSQGSDGAKEQSQQGQKTDGEKTICIDFGGTICDDGKNGNGDGDSLGAMVEGANSATEVLKENGWKIVVYTRMDADKVREWLNKNGVKYDDVVTGEKPSAEIYLGQHMMMFRGDWKWAIDEIASYRPWTQRKEDEKKCMQKSYKRMSSIFDEAKMVM